VSRSDANPAPPYPSLGQPTLIPFYGYHAPLDVEAIDRRVVGAIAKPLVHAAVDRETVERAREAGLGVALPGEAWRNQLEPGHQKRAGAFEDLSYALAERLRIDAWLSERFIADYAALHLDAQIQRGATILCTPGHVLPREGGRGRENEVALVEATIAEYTDRRARHSRGAETHRPLFATIIVRGEHVLDAVPRIVRAYAPLAVDGFWVVVANCNQSLRQLKAVSALCDALESRTGRPTLLSGVGPMHLAFLGHDVVSATCTGHHGGSLVFPPAEWPRREGEDQGLGIHVQHRAILGAVQLGSGYDDERRMLFERFPCPCGHHPASRPPRGNHEILGHNAWTLMADAASVCTREPEDRRDYIEMRKTRARAVRGEFGLGALRAGWRGPAEFAREGGQDEDEVGEVPR
jgi:hypothetical protein